MAVAADTGDPVWGADATSTFCDVDVTGEPEDPLLAYAWRSGEVETLQGDWTWSDVEMDLVRLDPAAGGVLWTVQAGEPEAGAEGWGPAIWVLDDEHVVWQEEPARFDIVVPGSREFPAPDELIGPELYAPRVAAGEAAGTVPWPLPHHVGAEIEHAGSRVVADREGLTAYTAP